MSGTKVASRSDKPASRVINKRVINKRVINKRVINKRVGIMGLGAVGTSIGLALREAGFSTIGFDASRANLLEALNMGAVVEGSESADTFDSCREVFVAVPPGMVVPVAESLLKSTRATIVDVASVKAEIAGTIGNPRFVPSHPLRGTHLTGPSAARKDLFEGAIWVVCPTIRTPPQELAAVEDLIRGMGAEPLRMDAGEHDAMVAATSHLPHVTASSLVHVLRNRGPEARRLVAGGFLDTTRIARANPDLWTEITMQNSAEVCNSIDELIGLLASVKDALHRQDKYEVLSFFSDACGLLEKGLPVPVEKCADPRRLPAVSRFISFVNHHRGRVVTELGGVH